MATTQAQPGVSVRMGVRALLVASLVVVVTGCATARPGTTATPIVEIRPGVAQRIALMDRYRLHDEDRKRFMQRPHVWVEEVAADDEPSEDENDTNDDP